MHIPDGYLSPASAGVMYAASLPFWVIASRKLKASLSGTLVPRMALMSAFCFVIQMLNIPLPGGTTGHAVGASLAGIVLTPWPAVLAVSVALIIQALFFGDGGITALGANCFNMAIVQVFVSYYIYSTIPATAPRGKAIAAAVAGYISVNVAGLLAGIQLGVQPLLAHAPDGTPLYAPYPLKVAVPAMLVGHLLAGFAEAAVAAAGIAFLLRSSPELLPADDSSTLPVFWLRLRFVLVILGILIVLTPLGLLAPGTAWGEWSSGQFYDLGLGFVPRGMQKLENFWQSFFPDYTIPGLGPGVGYFLSALLGVLLIFLVFQFTTWCGKMATKKA